MSAAHILNIVKFFIFVSFSPHQHNFIDVSDTLIWYSSITICIKATPAHRGIVKHCICVRVYTLCKLIPSIGHQTHCAKYRLVARFKSSILVSRTCSPCNSHLPRNLKKIILRKNKYVNKSYSSVYYDTLQAFLERI